MNMQNGTATGVDPEAKWMYRVAGIAAVVLGVGYLVAIPIYVLVGDQP